MSERAAWTNRHRARADDPVPPPSPFVVEALSRLEAPRAEARAIDIACGSGRHALLLARHGYAVLGVDWAVPPLRRLRATAARERLPVTCLATDLTTCELPDQRYALVLSTNFLDRPCFVRMRRAVEPGGVLLLETFLDGHQHHGHPRNPAYLLRPGELADICRGWEILAAHEGLVTRANGPAMMAGMLARRPGRTLTV